MGGEEEKEEELWSPKSPYAAIPVVRTRKHFQLTGEGVGRKVGVLIFPARDHKSNQVKG